MSGLQDFISKNESELQAFRTSLLRDLHEKPSQSCVPLASSKQMTEEIGELEKQNRLLLSTVDGISDMSREILSSIRVLKHKKRNINDLLNRLSSIIQVKQLSEKIDAQDGQGSADALKKFAIELHYSLQSVPRKYFEEEFKKYDRMKARLEPVLKQRLETALVSQKLSEVNSITTLLSVLSIEFDVEKQFKELFSSELQAKVDTVSSVLEKKMLSFGSIQACLGSTTELSTMKTESQTARAYPEIFYQSAVDALTVLFEAVSGLKDSSFVTGNDQTLQNFLALMFDKSLADFVKKTKVQMDRFYQFDFNAFLSSKEELSITIEKDEKRVKVASKLITEIMVLECYLNELMSICSQFKLFVDEVAQEISHLTCDRSKAGAWTVPDIKRLLSSYSYGAEVMQLNMCFKMVQERIVKMRMSIILSQSPTLRAFFHGDAPAISSFLLRVEESDALSDSSGNPASAYEYLDELFYCLKNSILRAIKTLDKICACSIVNFVCTTVICTDLLKLTKQLSGRFLALADGQESGVCLAKPESTRPNYNQAAASVISSIGMVSKFATKLAEQAEECAVNNFEDAELQADLQLIKETISSMSSHVTRTFQDLQDSALAQVAEGVLKGSVLSILDNYKSYDFIASEKNLQEFEAYNSKWSIAAKLEKRIAGCLLEWSRLFSQELFDSFISSLAQTVCSHVLGLIRKKKFNQLGAIILEKEVARLKSIFEAEAPGALLKQPFAKLAAVSALLMADTRAEALGAGSKHLSEKETADLLGLRVDLI